VGYDAETSELEIEFHSGQVYVYEQVPQSVYDWLLRAPNKGIFVTRQIAGRYPERALSRPAGTAPDALEQALRDSLARLEG
jgi:KTSC domain